MARDRVAIPHPTKDLPSTSCAPLALNISNLWGWNFNRYPSEYCCFNTFKKLEQYLHSINGSLIERSLFRSCKIVIFSQ